MSQQNKPGDSFAKIHHYFQAEIRAYAEQRGWQCDSLAYHDVWGDDADSTKLLIRKNNPTALAIRGASDLVWNHRDLDLTLHVEVKSNDGQWPNCSLEMVSLVRSYVNWQRFGIDTLYIYKDFGNSARGRKEDIVRAAFVQDLIPLVKRIVCPDKASIGLPPEFEDIIRVEFPLGKVYEEVKIHRRADRWDPA